MWRLIWPLWGSLTREDPGIPRAGTVGSDKARIRVAGVSILISTTTMKVFIRCYDSYERRGSPHNFIPHLYTPPKCQTPSTNSNNHLFSLYFAALYQCFWLSTSCINPSSRVHIYSARPGRQYAGQTTAPPSLISCPGPTTALGGYSPTPFSMFGSHSRPHTELDSSMR